MKFHWWLLVDSKSKWEEKLDEDFISVEGPVCDLFCNEGIIWHQETVTKSLYGEGKESFKMFHGRP